MKEFSKVRVGAVSYLNTRPLVYGFEQGMMKDVIQLVSDYPSRIADHLLNDEIDVGLVPVAILPALKESHIISNFCIGCSGPVASVCIFSEVPIEKIERLYLDYQSRSSVALTRVLLREYWKVEPELIDAPENFTNLIKGTTAALVIGDRALKQRLLSSFIYDLGEAWIAHTRLPFVFAAWISNKKLDENFITAFNHANGEGFKHIREIIGANPFPSYDLNEYYTKNIDYRFDEQKRKGLKLFVSKLPSFELTR
ncbi:MAG: menaquinone biosynthesis protein [Chitinophagaceae bacterium]